MCKYRTCYLHQAPFGAILFPCHRNGNPMKIASLLMVLTLTYAARGLGDNIPACPPCDPTFQWQVVSEPSTWGIYNGPPDNPDWDYPSSENPSTLWSFIFALQGQNWSLTIPGPTYAVNQFQSPDDQLLMWNLSYADWEAAVYHESNAWVVGPDNRIVPVAPEPGSMALLWIGLVCLAATWRWQRHREATALTFAGCCGPEPRPPSEPRGGS